MLLTASMILAHQGGWDEMLMVLTPIAVFALLLKMANSRANKARDEQAAAQTSSLTPADDPADGPADDPVGDQAGDVARTDD